MRAVFGLVLIVGMGLAGFAVYMVNGFVAQTQTELDQERQRVAAAVPTVEVYAVNRPMAYGETLTQEDVVAIQYAEPFLPEGVFHTIEEIFPDGDEELRVVTRPMEVNEAILAVKVTEPGDIAGITSLLAPGMRAFTIEVDVQSGVSGFLRPGDRVDVYWSGDLRLVGLDSQRITQLIKSSVELIAIDQTADGNRTNAEVARTVTVQVSPQDVALLAQAQSTGDLSLSLVGANDSAVVDTINVSLGDIIDYEKPVVEEVAPVIVEEAAKVCTIKTRRGAEVVEIPIPCTN